VLVTVRGRLMGKSPKSSGNIEDRRPSSRAGPRRGITYWPLIEIVNDLAGVTGTRDRKLLAGTQPQVVASRRRCRAGRCERPSRRQWAVRLFEAPRAAVRAGSTTSTGPSPAMLDLIEHVAANATSDPASASRAATC
jgi:hypothetical protein